MFNQVLRDVLICLWEDIQNKASRLLNTVLENERLLSDLQVFLEFVAVLVALLIAAPIIRNKIRKKEGRKEQNFKEVQEEESLKEDEIYDEIDKKPVREIFQKIPEEITKKEVAKTLSHAVKSGGFFSRLQSIWKKDDSGIFESLEEALILSDVGAALSGQIIQDLKTNLHGEMDPEKIKKELSEVLSKVLKKGGESKILENPKNELPWVLLITGVNGAGKTTTIGKLANRWASSKVLLAACDTFRAAAREQLYKWAERTGATIEKGQEGEKPSTVAWRALEKAIAENFDIVIIDTAGRLHTKSNLMEELSGIHRVIHRHVPGAPHETLLVIDGATGQNAVQQAMKFTDHAKLTGVILTKLDGSSKGGAVLSVVNDLQIPIRLVGTGEGVEDLVDFSPQEFIDSLLET